MCSLDSTAVYFGNMRWNPSLKIRYSTVPIILDLYQLTIGSNHGQCKCISHSRLSQSRYARSICGALQGQTSNVNGFIRRLENAFKVCVISFFFLRQSENSLSTSQVSLHNSTWLTHSLISVFFKVDSWSIFHSNHVHLVDVDERSRKVCVFRHLCRDTF